jgi:hypothetical protein
MVTDLVTIKSILLEHTVIKRCIEALRQAVADQATFLFDSESNWDNTHLKQLKDNHLKLVHSVQAFKDKLAAHYIREERDLLPLFGTFVAEGNAAEHKEITQHLERAYYSLSKAKLLGDLKPQELMAATYDVERIVEIACRVVETHEATETNLFALMKKGLPSEDGEHL